MVHHRITPSFNKAQNRQQLSNSVLPINKTLQSLQLLHPFYVIIESGIMLIH